MQQKSQTYKIGLYIRVSTEEQAENPEGSIKNQEERLRQTVEFKNRVGNFGEIAGVFIDAGISAKDMKRPRLQELLRQVRAKEINLIMVTEISRLSRNIRDFVEMWDLMRAHDCRFSSLREDFDTTTAAGEMVLFQLMNLAQFERKQTSERVQANIAVRAARGLYNGGMVPVGYRKVLDRPGFLEADPEMVPTVQAAFTAFLRTGSLSPAAKWLNDNGFYLRKETEGGGRFKRVGHFSVDNLQAMLRNKAYTGIKVYHHNDELKEVKAVWPAIIDEITFKRAGEVLKKNHRRFKPHKQNKLPYLFSGVVVCQTCKSHMPGKSATGNTTKVGYYEHSWATKRDSTLSKKLLRCEPHRVPAKKLEPLAWQKVIEFMNNADFTKRVFEQVRKLHKENPNRKDMERLQAKILGVHSQIEALSERLSELPKNISAAPIYRQMEKLQVFKEDHEKGLLALKNDSRNSLDRLVGLDTFENFAALHRKFISSATVDQKKQLIKKFVRKLEVSPSAYKIHFIVDGDHYKRELALHETSRSSAGVGSRFFRNLGSNTLTIGAPKGTTFEPLSRLGIFC